MARVRRQAGGYNKSELKEEKFEKDEDDEEGYQNGPDQTPSCRLVVRPLPL